MDQPLWLANAWAELGQREVAGSADNPHIRSFFREASGSSMADEVPWCAAFVGACLERAGVASTRSLMARSYLRWGDALKEGRFGAIAVFSRGGDPSTGHVGFLVGETGAHVYLLGGNQGDAVTVAAMARSRLLGLRWPQQSSSAKSPETKIESPLFDRALVHVLEMEGGFTDDPYDSGGPTNFGITLRVYAEWKGVPADASLKGELQHIPQADVRAIYAARYWQPAGCDQFPCSGFLPFRRRRESWRYRRDAAAAAGRRHGRGRRDRAVDAGGDRCAADRRYAQRLRGCAPPTLSRFRISGASAAGG